MGTAGTARGVSAGTADGVSIIGIDTLGSVGVKDGVSIIGVGTLGSVGVKDGGVSDRPSGGFWVVCGGAEKSHPLTATATSITKVHIAQHRTLDMVDPPRFSITLSKPTFPI